MKLQPKIPIKVPNLKKTKKIQQVILQELNKNGLVLLPPCDALTAIGLLRSCGIYPTVTMFDPWYNKGVGGVREDYKEFIESLLLPISLISSHIYLWGFPEIVANFVNSLPNLRLNAWLTWYYKNSPSVIRGWRSSQQACIHYCTHDAKLYPQHFLSDEQNVRLKEGKMRFIPGPPSVIESSLLVGFVGKKEKTAHPAQKPMDVYKKLILMATQNDEIVFDPMAGSGTTGDTARILGRKSILSDSSEEYTQIMEKRLGIKRIKIDIN